MHHFFVSPSQVDLETKEIVIDGEDINHIKNVLRMKQGEQLLLSDGEGNDYLCTLQELGRDKIVAVIKEQQYEGTELPSKIYLFQGLPKADKMEMIIQKAVELGVSEIIPVKTERTVVKLDSKKEEAKLKRWNSIAQSAAKQSRRSILPQVKPVMGFAQAVRYAADFDINLLPYENYKDMQTTGQVINKIGRGMKIGIFIGPEGGFAGEEITCAKEHHMELLSLGRRILRTETAGLMLMSVVMFQLEQQLAQEESC